MFKKGYKAGYVTVVLKARSWRRAPMRLLKWGRKMPSTKQYNLVTNDDYDTRIPLHPEEAFHYGIPFPAKYIGSMEVPRPTSRVEIVAAMRRVRYEFKAKGVKKRKVTVDVSIEGVRVTTRKKKTKSKKKKKNKLFSEENDSSGNGTEIMHHPIYRIFYVSHDSSDLKIFSYIARDGATNAFKCNVFKSTKKSQAMRIVRTVGQAFEVCHKMQNDQPPEPAAAPSTSSMIEESAATSDRASDAPPFKDAASECEVSETGGGSSRAAVEVTTPAAPEEHSRPQHLELPPPPRKDCRRSPQRNLPPPTLDLPECITKVEVCSKEAEDASTPLSSQHQLQLLRERLEQQAQQTRAAVAQLLLLRDQLAAEQAARCEAQARTHQLLVHNKELLEHIAALVSHLQERERGSSRPISAQQLTLLPQAAMGQQQGFSTSISDGNFQYPNNNHPIPKNNDTLVNLLAKSNNITQNVQNNNLRFSPFNTSPTIPCTAGDRSISPNTFAQMSNEQIQNYLISKFKTMGEPEIKPETTERKPTIHYNQQFFQNSNAFPNIPPLTNHYSNTDIASLLNHNAFSSPQHALAQPADQAGASASAMSLGQSQTSLYSSPPGTSNDSSPEGFSSDDGAFFIMPLSHNATLTSKSEDGRVKLIVPVSPSGSISDVPELRGEATSGPAPRGNTLRAPGDHDLLLLQPGPITRTTSEKVPNRSEMMAAMRSQWTRHTTK